MLNLQHGSPNIMDFHKLVYICSLQIWVE